MAFPIIVLRPRSAQLWGSAESRVAAQTETMSNAASETKLKPQLMLKATPKRKACSSDGSSAAQNSRYVQEAFMTWPERGSLESRMEAHYCKC